MLLEKVDISTKEDYLLKVLCCSEIASKIHYHKDINKVFKANELEFIKAYKESELFNNPFFSAYSVKTEPCAKQVAGIIEYTIKTNDSSYLATLLSKCFKKPFNNIKHKSWDEYELDEFISTMILGCSDLYNREVFTFVYIFELLNRNFIKSNFYLSDLATELSKMEAERIIVEESLKDKIIKENYSKILKLKKEFGLDTVKNETPASDILHSISLKEQADYNEAKLKKALDEMNNNSNNLFHPAIFYNKDSSFHKELMGSLTSKNSKQIEEALDFMDKLRKSCDISMDEMQIIGEKSKHIGLVTGLCKLMGINARHLFFNISLSKSDIDKIIYTYIMIVDRKKMEDNTKNWLVPILIYFYAILKQFNELRDDFISISNEEHLVKEKTLNDEITALKAQLEDANNEIASLKDLNTKNTKEISRLNKSNIKLDKAVLAYTIKEKENIKELTGLREFAYTLNNKEDIDIDSFCLDEIISSINNHGKIALITGATNWTNKLKEVLNITFINGDSTSRDLKFLSDYDVVLMDIRLGHGMSYKINKIISKSLVKFRYLETNSNIQRSILDINAKIFS